MNSSSFRSLVALLVGFSLLAAACSESEATGPRVNKSGTRELHHRHEGGFPHYIGHFEAEEVSNTAREEPASTSGLEWFGGALHESVASGDKSSIAKIDAESGEVVNQVSLADGDIGAGLTFFDGRLYQLTRESNNVLVYETETLSVVDSLPFDGEGRGLCNSDGNYFVMSDGSSKLTVRNLETFEIENEITVELNEKEVSGLDELECIDDQVWATIDDTEDVERGSTIVVINVASFDDNAVEKSTTEVEATVDASQIVPEELEDDSNVTLSGIALRPDDGSLWLTGPGWPATYQVRLVPVDVE